MGMCIGHTASKRSQRKAAAETLQIKVFVQKSDILSDLQVSPSHDPPNLTSCEAHNVNVKLDLKINTITVLRYDAGWVY